jgi:hypothetical protein
VDVWGEGRNFMGHGGVGLRLFLPCQTSTHQSFFFNFHTFPQQHIFWSAKLKMGDPMEDLNPSSLQNQVQALNIEADEEDTQTLASDLLQKCQTLLSEVEIFSKFLDSQNGPNEVELRRFKNDIKTELKSIEKVCYHLHSVRST